MSHESRLPDIESDLATQLDELASQVADAVMAAAEPRVPVDTGDLKGALHVDREEDCVYSVIAGNDDVFYGHLVEHGGAYSAPQPFMVPAAEEVTAQIPGMGKAMLKDL